MREKKELVTRNFLRSLCRGVVKSVPLGGGLLEQVIFGTLDGEAAAQESRKLHSALGRIAEQVGAGELTLQQLLTMLEGQVQFRDEVRSQLVALSSAVADPGRAPIPSTIADAVERIIEGYGERIDDLGTELADMKCLLYRIAARLGALPGLHSIHSPAGELSVAHVINALALMHPSVLDTVVVSFPEARPLIAPNARPRDKANQLVEWATCQSPSRLIEVVEVARKADQSFMG